MKISEKRKVGEILGREMLAILVKQIAKEIQEGSYKDAMVGAGKIVELAAAATYDDYWHEKVMKGRYTQVVDFYSILNEPKNT